MNTFKDELATDMTNVFMNRNEMAETTDASYTAPGGSAVDTRVIINQETATREEMSDGLWVIQRADIMFDKDDVSTAETKGKIVVRSKTWVVEDIIEEDDEMWRATLIRKVSKEKSSEDYRRR